jgi:AraC family transcriptional regulator
MTANNSTLTSVFSTKDTWPGFRIDHCKRPPMHVTQTVSQHVLKLNVGASLNLAWKSNGAWNKDLCHSGAVIGLLSHHEQEEMQWEQECDSLELSFTPHFVDGLLEVNNVRFSEQRNVNDPFLKGIGAGLYTEMQHGTLFEKMYLESLSIACVIHLAANYPVASKKVFAPKGKLSSGQIKTVTEFTKANIHNEVSLAAMASTVHLSAFHFARLFKDTVGLSPHQFVLQMKIDQAKKLLRQKQESITDVAYALNFTDQAHFCNTFKKIAGISPRQFAGV